MKFIWLLVAVVAFSVTSVGCTDPPQISGISPNTGPLAGGTAVTVTGSNFDSKTRLAIAGLLCSSVTYAGSNAITATTPAGPSLGSWDVEVINKDGQRDKLKGGFTYSTGVTEPTIQTVTPSSGSAGTVVIITGTNFQNTVTVLFGTATATAITELNGTQITCTAPTGVTGLVAVTVTNPDGGTVSLPSAFNFGGTATTTPTAATITTVAGSATRGFTGDGGLATSAELSGPMGLAVGSDSSLYIADTQNSRIRQIGTSGIINTVAGGTTAGFSDGAGVGALLKLPRGLAIDSAGTLYIADTGNHAIRTLSSGQLITIAGTGIAGNTGDAGIATSALLSSPNGVSVDGSLNIVITDTGNNRIRRIDAATKSMNNFAGSMNGQGGFSGDGATATGALLSGPEGIVFDTSSNTIYFADTGNNRVRKIDSANNINTFAGTGATGFQGDGGTASSAELSAPSGVALDSAKALYICDTNNQRIRVVTAGSLTITTYAGVGTQGYSGDNAGAIQASLNTPFGIAANTSANLIFITDSGDGSVREIH